MSEDNPYAPPEADVTVSDSSKLATRSARLGGAVIDTLLAILVILPIMYATGFMDRAQAGEQVLTDTILYGLLALVLFLAMHGYLLAKYGQTIGKRIAKTRIVSVNDEKILPLRKVFVFRYLPFSVVSQIPFIGGLLSIVNVLFIFREDRRCVHDLVAGTKVISAE